ncbi:MAG TPA: hypothetical protein PLI52_02890 [Prochlorococcaceae cyanobacterium AMR_MDS_5431]|nr:hypothetical protein [Prochlorococcaceae cyanobacterium AMR_MDS_5431]
MWVGNTLISTGISIPPTQHINPSTGEPCYYVKPVNWPCGAYVRHKGIVDYVKSLTEN